MRKISIFLITSILILTLFVPSATGANWEEEYPNAVRPEDGDCPEGYQKQTIQLGFISITLCLPTGITPGPSGGDSQCCSKNVNIFQGRVVTDVGHHGKGADTISFKLKISNAICNSRGYSRGDLLRVGFFPNRGVYKPSKGEYVEVAGSLSEGGLGIWKSDYPNCHYIKRINKPKRNEQPVARCNISPNNPKVRERVTISASNSYDPDGHIKTYRWNFDEYSDIDEYGETVYHSFNDPGYHEVELEIEDNDGATDSTTCSVRVEKRKQKPTASFTYSPSKIKADDMVTFNASDSSDPDGRIDEYRWSFTGRGTDEYGRQVNNKFTSPGEYEVKLKVIDNDGLSDTTSKTITVNPKAKVANLQVRKKGYSKGESQANKFKPGDDFAVKVTIKNDSSLRINELTCRIIVWAPWAGSKTKKLSNLSPQGTRELTASWNIPKDAKSGNYSGMIICTGKVTEGTVVPLNKNLPDFQVEKKKTKPAVLKFVSSEELTGKYTPGEEITLEVKLKNEGNIPVDKSLNCRTIVYSGVPTILKGTLADVQNGIIPANSTADLTLEGAFPDKIPADTYSGTAKFVCSAESTQGNLSPLPGNVVYDFQIEKKDITSIVDEYRREDEYNTFFKVFHHGSIYYVIGYSKLQHEDSTIVERLTGTLVVDSNLQIVSPANTSTSLFSLPLLYLTLNPQPYNLGQSYQSQIENFKNNFSKAKKSSADLKDSMQIIEKEFREDFELKIKGARIASSIADIVSPKSGDSA